MEKFSSFERVIGKATEKEKKEILQKKEELFGDQKFDELVGMEREKTFNEEQIISLANKCTDDVRRRYGLPGFNVPSKNIHIIKKEKWPREESALYNSMMQAVAVKEQSANIVFMKKMIHELLHFKSYNALQITNGDASELNEYRVGLTVTSRDGKNLYFKNLNEAVTEEMTRRILINLRNNSLFSGEIDQTGRIIREHPDAKMENGEYLFDENTFYAEMKDSSNIINTESFTNVKERMILDILIDKLFERNREKFKNRESIFEIFSEAMMTGNMLSIGKLIDSTFGKGVFRKIGELDKNIQEQKNFVFSL